MQRPCQAVQGAYRPCQAVQGIAAARRRSGGLSVPTDGRGGPKLREGQSWNRHPAPLLGGSAVRPDPVLLCGKKEKEKRERKTRPLSLRSVSTVNFTMLGSLA